MKFYYFFEKVSAMKKNLPVKKIKGVSELVLVCVCILSMSCSPKKNQINTHKPPTPISTFVVYDKKQTIHPSKSPTINASTIIYSTFTPDSNYLRNLIIMDYVCDTPCILGIIPGRTKLDELIKILDDWHLEVSPNPKIIQSYSYHTGYDFNTNPLHKDLTFDIDIVIDNELVTGLIFYIETGLDDSVARDDWSQFQPESIINTYNTPDDIKLFINYPIEGTEENTVSYNLYYFYYGKNIIVEYQSKSIIASDNYIKICPGIDSFYWNRIWMGDGIKDAVNLDERFSLVSKVNMSVDSFSNQLKNNPSSFCFNYPR
jgi:hypothetical protein